MHRKRVLCFMKDKPAERCHKTLFFFKIRMFFGKKKWDRDGGGGGAFVVGVSNLLFVLLVDILPKRFTFNVWF